MIVRSYPMWKNNLFNMPSIKVRIDKFIRDGQPGFVECSFTDAWGTRHIMQDKVPIFTAKDLCANSVYPQEGIVACEVVKKWRDKEGRLIFTVDTERPWGVDSLEGLTQFDLLDLELLE